MSPRRNAPDPEALAKAREIQGRLQPAEVILLGSRGTWDHRPDSDVDLMAAVPDETAAKDADPILRHLLKGKYEVLWGKRSPSPGRSSGAQRPWLNPKRGRPPATGRP